MLLETKKTDLCNKIHVVIAHTFPSSCSWIFFSIRRWWRRASLITASASSRNTATQRSVESRDWFRWQTCCCWQSGSLRTIARNSISQTSGSVRFISRWIITVISIVTTGARIVTLCMRCWTLYPKGLRWSVAAAIPTYGRRAVKGLNPVWIQCEIIEVSQLQPVLSYEMLK